MMATREKLLAQDCLTTLIDLDPSGESAEVTCSMIGYVPVAEENAPLTAHMAEPNIRIVSLTVTEGGYYQTSDGSFDGNHTDILQDSHTPHTPKTAFGALVEAVRRRRDRGFLHLPVLRQPPGQRRYPAADRRRPRPAV